VGQEVNEWALPPTGLPIRGSVIDRAQAPRPGFWLRKRHLGIRVVNPVKPPGVVPLGDPDGVGQPVVVQARRGLPRRANLNGRGEDGYP